MEEKSFKKVTIETPRLCYKWGKSEKYTTELEAKLAGGCDAISLLLAIDASATNIQIKYYGSASKDGGEYWVIAYGDITVEDKESEEVTITFTNNKKTETTTGRFYLPKSIELPEDVNSALFDSKELRAIKKAMADEIEEKTRFSSIFGVEKDKLKRAFIKRLLYVRDILTSNNEGSYLVKKQTHWLATLLYRRYVYEIIMLTLSYPDISTVEADKTFTYLFNLRSALIRLNVTEDIVDDLCNNFCSYYNKADIKESYNVKYRYEGLDKLVSEVTEEDSNFFYNDYTVLDFMWGKYNSEHEEYELSKLIKRGSIENLNDI